MSTVTNAPKVDMMRLGLYAGFPNQKDAEDFNWLSNDNQILAR